MSLRRRTLIPTAYDEPGLIETMRGQYLETVEAEKHSRRTYASWAKLAPEPKSGVVSFDRFPFQRELVGQEVALQRELVIAKSTQVGVSMLLWRWAAWRADVWGDTVLYVFPTEKHVSKFGDERIEPSIQASAYLTRRIPAQYVRQKQLKRIGNGWLHLQGANSRAGAQSVAADSLVFDEYDELDQSNVEQIERRISGAAAAGRQPRVRRVGVPTIPGFGIDGMLKRSDYRRWLVRCERCGRWAPVTWESVRWSMPGSDETFSYRRDDFDDPKVVGEVWRACQNCETEIDVRAGRWQPTRESRTVGYHLPRLIVPHTDLAAIVVASRAVQPHEIVAFRNNDLGEAWQAADAGITEEEVLRAASLGSSTADPQGPQIEPVVLGLDVASSRNLHAVVQRMNRDGTRDALAMRECADFADAAALMRRYAVRLAVVDHLPETRSARALQADFPGRVLLAAYAEHPAADPYRYDETRLMVTANRTVLLDATLEALRTCRTRPLAQLPPHYIEHLTALHRQTLLLPNGQPHHRYISTGPDDWAHAEGYAALAAEMVRFDVVSQAVVDREYQPVADADLGYERVALDDGRAEIYQAGMGGWESDFT